VVDQRRSRVLSDHRRERGGDRVPNDPAEGVDLIGGEPEYRRLTNGDCRPPPVRVTIAKAVGELSLGDRMELERWRDD
jgi:hypothetical protein